MKDVILSRYYHFTHKNNRKEKTRYTALLIVKNKFLIDNKSNSEDRKKCHRGKKV